MKQNRDRKRLVEARTKLGSEATLSSLAKVNKWVERSPKAVAVKDKWGRLPLHLACRFGAPIEVIKCLMEAYPEAIKATQKDGKLPLQVAVVWCKSSREVVDHLARTYPEALNEVDDNGSLPLHLACLYGSSMEVVECLLQASPDAVKTANRCGRLPLHVACNREVNPKVLGRLIVAFPEAVKFQDKEGRFPLDRISLNQLVTRCPTLAKYDLECTLESPCDPVDEQADMKTVPSIDQDETVTTVTTDHDEDVTDSQGPEYERELVAQVMSSFRNLKDGEAMEIIIPNSPAVKVRKSTMSKSNTGVNVTPSPIIDAL